MTINYMGFLGKRYNVEISEALGGLANQISDRQHRESTASTGALK
jgi:hypothetical protein